MKEDNQFIQALAKLRQKAEAQLENNLSELSIPTTEAETAKLIRELLLYQIELELQNAYIQSPGRIMGWINLDGIGTGSWFHFLFYNPN